MTGAKLSPSNSKTLRAALVGTPNSGKTSLFNALTGGREKVGNYPGVTVEKIVGSFSTGDQTVELCDIPGLYSFRALSEDERVAVSSLKGDEKPDVILFVGDAIAFERSLFLFSQVAELGIPTIFVLTMVDLAEKEGRSVSVDILEREIGAPVVPSAPNKQQGMAALTARLGDARVPDFDLGWSESIKKAASSISELPENPGLSHREVVSLLVSGEEPAKDVWGDLVRQAREKAFPGSLKPKVADAQNRYAWASKVLKRTTQGSQKLDPRFAKLDAILTHKVFGLVIFTLVMYTVFFSIYTLAGPLMDLIEGGFAALGGWVGPMLAWNPTIQSLVVDGIIGGVGAAVVFLPQILILFAFISALEGSGYLARASFLMDKLFGWCGLNGRAFIPLLSSFACAIPGIMAARVMPDARSRLMTILVAPLMSCSARLPVYLLVIGAFIEPKYGPFWAGFALLALHFIGLALAVPIVFVLNKGVFKSGRLPFVMDMPRYQAPTLRSIWHAIYSRGMLFMQTAGTVIVVMSLVIWAALHFPTAEAKLPQYKSAYAAMTAEEKARVSEENYIAQQQQRDSFLGQTGRLIEPVLAPAGFDWRISTAVLASFPAREVVVSALGVMFEVGGDADEKSGDLRQALARATWPDGRPLITVWSALSFMVFFALCAQCMSTLAVMKRETGSWKWPTASFAAMTLLAYISAVLIYQLGQRLSGS